MKKLLLKNLLALSALALLAGCGGTKAGVSSSTSNVFAAPTDFVFDTKTGAFTFTNNDTHAGYYFVRAYSVTNGVEGTTYVASSARINGNTTGAKSGTIDTSAFGWGLYDVKLVSFAAADSGYTAPDPLTIKAEYGIGGVLEKPELLVMADGNEAQVVIDWYTLGDWYVFAALPEVTLNIYSDSALTTVVKTDTIKTTDLIATVDKHPAFTYGYIWGYDAASNHKYLNNQFGFKNDIYSYTLSAGTYYATLQAKSSDTMIFADSKVSDAVSFTLTSDAPTGTYTAAKSTLWADPSVMGVPCANAGDKTDRVDFAKTQTTTSKTVA